MIEFVNNILFPGHDKSAAQREENQPWEVKRKEKMTGGTSRTVTVTEASTTEIK